MKPRISYNNWHSRWYHPHNNINVYFPYFQFLKSTIVMDHYKLCQFWVAKWPCFNLISLIVARVVVVSWQAKISEWKEVIFVSWKISYWSHLCYISVLLKYLCLSVGRTIHNLITGWFNNKYICTRNIYVNY